MQQTLPPSELEEPLVTEEPKVETAETYQFEEEEGSSPTPKTANNEGGNANDEDQTEVLPKNKLNIKPQSKLKATTSPSRRD